MQRERKATNDMQFQFESCANVRANELSLCYKLLTSYISFVPGTAINLITFDSIEPGIILPHKLTSVVQLCNVILTFY